MSDSPVNDQLDELRRAEMGAEPQRPPTLVRPVGARVLVQRVQGAEQSKGGVLLPDAARERPNEGVVLAVGDACGIPMSAELMDRFKVDPRGGIPRLVPFQKGDTVLFGAYSGLPLTGDEAGLVILGEDEVVAVRMAAPPQPETPA